MNNPIDAQDQSGSENVSELGVAAAAAAIRDGALSSEHYATVLLERTRANADLNAFVAVDDTAVLEKARKADKLRAEGISLPLLGVPIGVKDSYLTKGMRTTFGLEHFDFVPARDAASVAALKSAGAIVFGKNNLVAMSYGLTGDSSRHGQVLNPHNRSHVSGGSSSGSGAAVAARLVPASLGGDTVGSIRVPASLTGVVGYKPTNGRWPSDGVAPVSHTLDSTGVLTRSVEDSILIDAVITRGRFPRIVPKARDLRGVKLAVASGQFQAIVAPEVDAHFHDLSRRLVEAGVQLIEVDLGGDFAALTQETAWTLFFYETRSAIIEFLQANHVPTTFEHIHRGIQPFLQAVWEQRVVPHGEFTPSHDVYEKARTTHRDEIKRRFKEMFATSGVDALIFPTTPTTAPTILDRFQFRLGSENVSFTALANHTLPANIAGLPGITIPTGMSSKGLPFGVELDGRHGDDNHLLSIAQRMEEVIGDLVKPG